MYNFFISLHRLREAFHMIKAEYWVSQLEYAALSSNSTGSYACDRNGSQRAFHCLDILQRDKERKYIVTRYLIHQD
jgi:hypothetical protein